MRRRAFVAATALLAMSVAGTAGEVYTPNRLEQVVPASALALVQVEDLSALAAAYRKSALAQAIQGSPMLSYFATVAPAAAQLGGVVLTGRPAEKAHALVGSHVGLVLLDPAGGGRPLPIALLVEVTDADEMAGILKTQLGLFGLLAGKELLSESVHAEVKIYEVALPNGPRLNYCFHKGFFVLGSRTTVRALLDELAADKPRVASLSAYQAVRRHVAAPAGISGYLNLGALLERQRKGMADRPGQNAGLQTGLRAFGVVKAQALGVAMEFHGRKIRDRVYLHTGGDHSGVLRLMTEGKPIAPTTGAFIPTTYTVVSTMSLRDVGLWDRARQMATDAAGEAAAGQLEFVAETVLEQAKFRIKEDLLDTFGDEGFLAADLSKLGEFMGTGRQLKPQDIPFIAGARLRNAAGLTKTLDRIAGNQRLADVGVERVTKKHREANVATFRLPFAADVQPSYAIVDGVFLFSIRPEAVTAAIDAAKTKKNLAASPLVKQAAGEPPALPAEAHWRLDVSDARLTSILLGLVRSEAPEPAQRLLPQLDRILAGLSGYGAVLRREPEGFLLTAASDLGTLGTVVIAGVCLDQFKAVVAKRVGGDFDQIAAALEKYHARHKAYPESLELLVPDYLPAVPRDRFLPKQGYRYSRGRPNAGGKFPDVWILVSAGPDKDMDIPIEEFDPATWAEVMRSDDPVQVARLKILIYQFRKDKHGDEKKADDEGDLFRMGGKGMPKTPGRPGAKPVQRAPAEL